MSKPLKWLLRIALFLALTFLLLLSGVFNPLAESLKTPAASFMNHFNFGDPVLFSDAYSENLDSMWFDIYVTLNAIAAVVGTFILEQVLKRAR